MNRRSFLLAGLSSALFACAPAPLMAARFEPTRFSVQVQGTGPDVILIPGLSSGRDLWRGTVERLPGYRYHLVQVAGFAGDPVRGNREGAVLIPLAEEIARYISDRRLRQPAIVGHSMGGTLAMLVGARHPDLAGRIMVVDMLPQPAGLFGGNALDVGPLLGNLVRSSEGRRLMGSLMGAFTPPESSHRRSDPDLLARAAHELGALDLAPALPRIRAPLTIAYGAPDPRGAAAIDRSFASAYAPARSARLVRIDGAGHMVMLDQPTRFVAALRDFLDR